MSAVRTPAIATAQRAGIEYRIHAYEHDPRADGYGLEAAEKLGVGPERLFKTLVVSVDGALTIALVPADAHLDLRALGKRTALAEPHEAERATGYVTGGISPLGQRKRLPTVVDESACAFETVYVSAGRRGLQIELAPADLVRLTGARIARIASRA